MTLARMADQFPNFGPNAQPDVTISKVFRNLIDRFEERRGHSISVMSIAADYELQHRRVYEFFNLRASLGVCSRIERGQLDWNGLAEVPQTLETAYAEIEIASLDKTIDAVFKLDKSPSLTRVLFHDRQSDIKTLQRRIYLVLHFLEVIGTVEHAKSVSEYRLMLEPTAIVENALKKRKEACNESDTQFIDVLLNHYGPEFLIQLRDARRDAFTRLTKK
jgi:hypothetical protein